MDRASVIKARIARARQLGESSHVVESLQRAYYTARAAEYVRSWITSDPAPTPEQRREVAELLVGGEADGTAA